MGNGKKDGQKNAERSYANPEDFSNMKFINDYQNKLKQGNQRVTRSKQLLLTNLIISLLCVILFLPGRDSLDPEISSKNEFDFCEFKNNINPIDVDNICKRQNEKINSSLIVSWLQNNYVDKFFSTKNNFTNSYSKDEIFYHFQATLLSKSINQVSGKAFQCRKLRT